MIKMLFSDMDGTIIDFNEMKHEHDKEMLEELKKQGHLIALIQVEIFKKHIIV